MGFLTGDDPEVGTNYGSLAARRPTGSILNAAPPFPATPPVHGYLGDDIPQPAPMSGSIVNGAQINPLDHMGAFIADHSNILRQRLLAAHLQNGLPPEQFTPGVADPLAIVRQTRQTGQQNLAQLLARFNRQPHGRVRS